MRISDWSSDVCSSDLSCRRTPAAAAGASEVVPGAVRIATMPPDSATGQADSARAWFRSDAGLALLESEYPTVVRALSERPAMPWLWLAPVEQGGPGQDRKSTRLNSSH